MTTPSAQPPDKPQYDPQVLVQLAKIERAAVFPYMQRRNRLLPHSCFLPSDLAVAADAAVYVTKGTRGSCLPVASPAVSSFAVPFAPCTALKPVLQFLGLA